MASFEALAERVKLEGSGLSTDNKLNIYSLFKQVRTFAPPETPMRAQAPPRPVP